MRSKTYATNKDNGLESLAEDGDHGQKEKRPLGSLAFLAVVLGFGTGDLLVERALELLLPLYLGSVDTEHGETYRGTRG